jgi:hypothetical protein
MSSLFIRSEVWRMTGVPGERFLLVGVVVRQTQSKDLHFHARFIS